MKQKMLREDRIIMHAPKNVHLLCGCSLKKRVMGVGISLNEWYNVDSKSRRIMLEMAVNKTFKCFQINIWMFFVYMDKLYT